MHQKYQVAGYYTPEAIRKALAYDRFYCADRAAYFRDAQKQAMQRLDDDRNFARAEKFAGGEAKAQCSALRSEIMTFLRQQEKTAEQEAAAEKQRVTEAYRAFLQKTEPKLAARQKKRLQRNRLTRKRLNRPVSKRHSARRTKSSSAKWLRGKRPERKSARS